MDNLKNSLPVEVMHYICDHCGENKWMIFVGKRSNNETFLLISCRNKECIEHKRKELELEDNDLILWGEFNITGQFDFDDSLDENVKN